EVEDDIGPGEGLDESVEIVDVGGNVADVGPVRGSQVDDGDVMAGALQPVHHVRADEASAAGHQGSHANPNPSPRSAPHLGTGTTVPERERTSTGSGTPAAD